MKNSPFRTLFVAIFLVVVVAFLWPGRNTQAQKAADTPWITGTLLDEQNQPVEDAHVSLLRKGNEELLAEAQTQTDGRYTLILPEVIPTAMVIDIERAHFKETRLNVTSSVIDILNAGETVVMPNIILDRYISPAFWIAAAIFVGVLVFIATGVLHNTLSTLVGATLLFLVSYLGPPFIDGLYIFEFHRSLTYVDWNVIFLIMGMMIVIAVVENTGVFQWLAFFAYRSSGGRMWLLLPILMLITGVASAFLDNVTTMLLMTPITVQIAISLGVNPLALLMPEVMASNVIGVSTLVGTPTNILIGSYGNISFNDFLANLTPGVLVAFLGLIGYSALIYRKELSSAHDASEVLVEKLRESGQITEPRNLKKGRMGGCRDVGYVCFWGENPFIAGCDGNRWGNCLMVWIRPDIEEMIEAVDWTTLVFFIALFIVVGAVQEVGLISMVADNIGRLVGENLLLAILSITWISAIFSMIVANIPFTAAMLPVVGFLTANVPGAEGKVLFYCLSVGAAMGGNGSLIGASANMVTAGIADSAGYPITYRYFLKKGFPALLITVALGTGWLLLRFL